MLTVHSFFFVLPRRPFVAPFFDQQFHGVPILLFLGGGLR